MLGARWSAKFEAGCEADEGQDQEQDERVGAVRLVLGAGAGIRELVDIGTAGI